MAKKIGRIFLKGILVLLILVVICTLIIGIALAVYIDRHVEKEIDETLFLNVGVQSMSKIYYYDYSDRTSRTGNAVELTDQQIYGGYRGEFVNIEEIPRNLKYAFIAIEDKRFEEHNGVDWIRSIGAGLNYFLKFNKSYGGSTITQQLIKNVTNKDDYTFQRKIQEIFWALDLETKLDKNEILELYLNIINMSQGCYGVGAASQYYFSKDVSDLTLSECACLAAITNSPSYYDPIRNPENNDARRRIILNQMYEQGHITNAEYLDAVDRTVVLNVNVQSGEERVNSWYVDMVIEDVINDLMQTYGYSRSMANLVLYTGGLNIYTVMDIDVQDALEKYFSDKNNFFGSALEESPQASMMIIDPETGDILGVAGAIGEKKGNRIQNFATSTKRPAGSVIKPLSVYAPALDKGIINWATVYDDTPVNFGNYYFDEVKGEHVDAVPWPKNSNGIYRGLTNINYAIEHSINTVTVKVLEDLGIDESFDFLYNKLQMKSLVDVKMTDNGSVVTDRDYAALALGQFNYGVSVREVVSAYSVLANNGVFNFSRSYISVTDNKGNSVLDNSYKGYAVIDEESADIMTLMLSNVVENGTASEIKLKTDIDCAGKTGTTQNKYDNWYVGYTPYYIGGVWMGYEYPKSLADFQGNKCISVWDEVMQILHEKYINAPRTFEISPNVVTAEYCADSGKIMTYACEKDARGARGEKGYFKADDIPSQLCDRHVMVDYDIIAGGVVVGNCPAENVKKVGFLDVEREFPIQIYVSDAQYTFREIQKDVLPETSVALPFFNNVVKKYYYCGMTNTTMQYNRACRMHFNYFDWKERFDSD